MRQKQPNPTSGGAEDCKRFVYPNSNINLKFSPNSVGASGRVLLAAIVHEEAGGAGDNAAAWAAATPSAGRLSIEAQSEARRANNSAGDTHDADQKSTRAPQRERIGAGGSFSKTFSRLFGSKQQRRLQQALAESAERNRMIDCNYEAANSFQSFTLPANACKRRLPSDEENNEQFREASFFRNQVIEFKFDLIVERRTRRRREELAIMRDGNVAIATRLDTSDENSNEIESASSARCLWEEANRVNDKVDELLESFVLESSDVCLMVTGEEFRGARKSSIGSKNSIAATSAALSANSSPAVMNNSGGNSNSNSTSSNSNSSTTVNHFQLAREPNDTCGRSAGQFKHLNQLTLHALTYSFKLLAEKQGVSNSEAANLNRLHANDSTATEDDEFITMSMAAGASEEEKRNKQHCSIELSAILLTARSSDDHNDRQRLELFDLLADDQDDLNNLLSGNNENLTCDSPINNLNKFDNDLKTIDCVNIHQALKVTQGIDSKLGEIFRSDATRQINLILIGLKLKQKINGGLFSNRLSLISFEPKFSKLNKIFETIFNGQALTYLKGKRDEMIELNDQLFGKSNGKQHNHQVACGHGKLASILETEFILLYKLEWLLYKQLSSALLKTLIIVNVRKIENLKQNRKKQELMGENLILLEFARLIQKASLQKLKRRKKHLRSHLLLTSSNISLANSNSLSPSPTRIGQCHQVNSTFGAKLTQSQYGASFHNQSKVPFLANFCRQTTNSRQQAAGFMLYSKTRTNMLNVNLAMSRHQRRHGRQAGGSRLHHYRSTSGIDDDHVDGQHYSFGPASSDRRQRQQRRLLATTESSSLSTESSGTSHNLPASAARRDSNGSRPNNATFSDTDSITSANLNSCSTGSYGTGKFAGSATRQRRDIELNWISKQPRRSKLESPSASIELSTFQLVSSAVSTPTNGPAHRRKESSTNSSAVIQIDCQGPEWSLAAAVESAPNGFSEDGQPKGYLGEDGQSEKSVAIEDNLSDICSIAEPPKQLKLEEFLCQLNNIIAPEKSKRDDESAPTTKGSLEDNGNLATLGDKQLLHPNRAVAYANNSNDVGSTNGQQAEEDDEDCKSHSSILEHLSSLAQESNTKLNNRGSSVRRASDSATVMAGDAKDDRQLAATGHLQKLINNSRQLNKLTNSGIPKPRAPAKNSPAPAGGGEISLEQKLQALTMSCRQQDQQQQLSSPCSTSSTSTSGAFVSSNSSNDSSCCSSLSSTNAVANLDNRNAIVTNKSKPPEMVPLQLNGSRLNA